MAPCSGTNQWTQFNERTLRAILSNKMALPAADLVPPVRRLVVTVGPQRHGRAAVDQPRSWPSKRRGAPALSGPWSTINTQAAPGSGLFEYLDTNPPAPAAFYRTSEP
jgi:hypothetical protein